VKRGHIAVSGRQEAGRHIESVVLRVEAGRDLDLRHFLACRDTDAEDTLDFGLLFGGRIENIDPSRVAEVAGRTDVGKAPLAYRVAGKHRTRLTQSAPPHNGLGRDPSTPAGCPGQSAAAHDQVTASSHETKTLLRAPA
jgi:hypothetical protein